MTLLKATSRTRGRPSIKRDQVMTQLREDIVSGRMSPGDRVPSRVEIQEKFGATSDTVHQAFRELVRDGLLEVRGNSGTFVVDRLPHLNHYALVYAEDPSRMPFWSGFYQAIVQCAESLASERRWRFESYFIHSGDPRSPDYARLISDLSLQRLAGVIFTVSPFELGDAMLDRLSGIPQVALASDSPRRGMPAVYPQREQFFTRAVQWLAGRGRRRAALIHWPDKVDSFYVFDAACHRHGITAPAHWRYGSNLVARETITHCVQTVLSLPANERPDSIVISDDNLVGAVAQGVSASLLNVGVDLDIVGYSNFPNASPTSLPIHRLGCDVNRLLRVCMSRIDEQRCGKRFRKVELIPVCSEGEFEVSRGLHSASSLA